MAASLGMLAGCLAATCLAMDLHAGPAESRLAACTIGTWQIWPGGLRIDCGLRADLFTTIWIAIASGLAGSVAWLARRTSDDTAAAVFSITTALALLATIGLAMSASLLQMLICWMLLSPIMLALVAWSSPLGAAVQGMRRAMQTGLVFDVLLLWSLLLIRQSTGTDELTKAFSAAGLQRLGAGNPALPGLVGCLLVLSVLGRCGLFPCFGWHSAASEWKGRLCAVVYGIALVPSGVWLLIKCQPVLALSDAPLTLVGGLGVLGAVLGAFVACGQADAHRRLAYLLSFPIGVILAGLGSGQGSAASLGIWHLCSFSISAVVLFLALDHGLPPQSALTNRVWPRHVAANCAALSIAGLMVCSGGWSQQALMAVNLRPLSWVEAESDMAIDPDESADASASQTSMSTIVQQPVEGAPHWGWICGLWLAQGLTAAAVARVVQVRTGHAAHAGPILRAVAGLGTFLLLTGGLSGWLLGAVDLPTSTDAVISFAIGQTVAIAGLIIGSRTPRSTSSTSSTSSTTTSREDSLTRLSRERLYVDQLTQQLHRWPLALVQCLFVGTGVDRFVTRMIIRGTAWVGTQTEALQIGRADFYLATLLLGTLTLLLTLFVLL